MNEADPTLAELIRRALASRLADVHVSMPGIVVDYDAAKKTATVQPALRRVLLNEQEDRSEEEIPPIKNVPVAFPGAASLTQHFNLAAGDVGVLWVPTNSTSEFQGTGKVSTPGSLKLHDLGSAIFFPTKIAAPTVSAETDESIGKPSGLRLVFKTATIEVGTGGDFVALSSLVTAALNTLKSAIASAAVVPNDGGAAFKANLLAALSSWPASLASSNLKADP